MTIYKKTTWGYVILKNNKQIGAGVGFKEPYGIEMTLTQRRMWRKQGLMIE